MAIRVALEELRSDLMRFQLVFWGILAFAILGLMLWAIPHFWEGLEIGVSGHGWFAYILGGVMTLALSIGLFFLTFYSARRGHDDIDPPQGS